MEREKDVICILKNNLNFFYRIVWDAKDLSLKKEIDLPTEIKEGWGFVKGYLKDENGVEKLHFYITDGSDNVYIVDAETWEVKKTLQVS